MKFQNNSVFAIILAVIMIILLAGITIAQRNTTDTFTPVTITGNITEVNHPIANFKSEDGTVYQIHMGPYWYWLDNGYKLNNESAVIKGEVKTVNGVNELYPVEVSQNSTTIKLTDEKGIPLWAGYSGNGYGRGNGYGWNNGACKYDSSKCANCVNKDNCCKNNNGVCPKGNNEKCTGCKQGNGNGNGCKYGKGNGNGNGNGYGWRNGNGNGNRWGNCQRNTTDNSDNSTGNQNGRGWRQNCPNRTK
ncbi:MAG: hypothetical protein ACOYN6_15380 [Ignavibacteria bacterium]